jgi:hypothetical protein
MPNTPSTLAVGQQIVSMLQALTNPDTTPVYTNVSLEATKDITDFTVNGGVCCEVYGDTDTSDRRRFGGVIYDVQTWFILSICALDTPQHAQQIYNARDALVVPMQQHAQLGGVPNNVWFSELQPNMKFFRIQRSGQWYRAHLAQLETRQQWNVSGGVIS